MAKMTKQKQLELLCRLSAVKHMAREMQDTAKEALDAVAAIQEELRKSWGISGAEITKAMRAAIGPPIGTLFLNKRQR